jgi:hypothetical protein
MTSPTQDASQPLLRDSPHNDYDSVASVTVVEEQAGDTSEHVISRRDLIWILCGLYSAVFLGALDGDYNLGGIDCRKTLNPP